MVDGLQFKKGWYVEEDGDHKNLDNVPFGGSWGASYMMYEFLVSSEVSVGGLQLQINWIIGLN